MFADSGRASSDILEWLREFRENLVDDEVPEHRDSHASSSHGASLEPIFKRREDLGKHRVYTHFPTWMGGRDDGHDHGHSTIGGRQAESGDIHVQCELTGDSLAEQLLEPVQKNISEGLDQVAVLSGLHLVPHHQSH